MRQVLKVEPAVFAGAGVGRMSSWKVGSLTVEVRKALGRTGLEAF